MWQPTHSESFHVPEQTAAAITKTKHERRRIVAVGTTVVRALEAASHAGGGVAAGHGVARGRISKGSKLAVADFLLTGVHEPGDSHFELLRAFADDLVLARMSERLNECRFQGHDFGDSVLLERSTATEGRYAPSSSSLSVPW